MTAQELARLIVEQGPAPGTEFTLSGPETSLGRELDCDISLISEQVSRHHAVIQRSPQGYLLVDQNSRNGTYVNAERLTAPRLLRDGDEVRLGQFVALRFVLPVVTPAAATAIAPTPKLEPAPPPTVAAPVPPAFVPPPAADSTLVAKRPTATQPVPPIEAAPPPPPPPPPPRLTIIVGGTTTTHDLTAAEYSLGRADDNDLVVVSSFVSRKHLRLVRTPAGYEVQVAPTATNPVLRGGQPLAGPSLLNSGDELVISPAAADTAVVMRYEVPGAPAAGAATPAVNAGPATRPIPRPNLEPAGPAPTARMEAPSMATMIGQAPVVPTVCGQLVVTLPGRPPAIHTLSDRDVRLGRAADNDIVIADEFVSRYQAQLRWTGDGFELVPAPDSTNSFQLDGRPVTGPTRLGHGARLRLGGSQPGERVSITYLASDDGQDPSRRKIDFSQKTRLTIGRDASNDIVLDAPMISRYHALVEKVGQRVRVQDLRSANGTFVNGQPIDGEIWLKPQDVIRIGPNRFVMGQDQLAQYDESDGVRVEVVGLNKRVRKDLNLLQDISLVFQKREFVVVVGQSGGGKSTLVDAISGYRPATQGQVFVNDVDVYKHFDVIRHNIGFVPQKDIIHMDLSVYEALDYSARLRMPADTTREERHQRVMEVLTDLDLAHRKDLKIAGLSGGQQKRVSIGVELLTKPGLFFLDEPTSGLDPGTETALMQLMRKLADQGRTIILITHATKNVMLADKVVFLARGGHLAWFGPPNEALAYFDQYRSERDRRAGPMEFDQIYNLLDDPANGAPGEWGERFRQHNAYQEFIVEPLQERTPQAAQQLTDSAAKRRRSQVSGLRQFFILSARNVRILLRDRASLLLMLMTAPAIGLLDVVLAAGQGRNPFSFANGDLNSVIVSLIVLINNGVMVGGLSQMRELVKERDIYKRERMVNLGLLPYILSKVWVAIVLAIYAATFFVIIRNVSFDMPGGWAEVGLMYVTLILLVVAGSMLGLFASALAPNANAAPLVLILFLVPQIVLSGALVPLPQAQTVIASSRWAFQAIMAITGAGSDVAADSCWKLPAAEYDDLTDEDFEARGCGCSGVSALRQDSCDFPGLGEYYDEAIDQPDPVEPAALRDEPAALVLPPEPEAPADMRDPQAVSDYLTALQDYMAEVNDRREVFQADMDAYRAEADAYRDAMKAYQEEKTDIEVARATAKGSAKARIRLFYDDFGWTFVDKSSAAYWRTLFTVWGAQLAIIFILFIATIFLQRRWDVA